MESDNAHGEMFLFTSESVGEGHPGSFSLHFLVFLDHRIRSHFHLDKICDQVSDAVLDACLAEDPNAKVACGKTKNVGEFSSIVFYSSFL